jgi:aspartokinase
MEFVEYKKNKSLVFCVGQHMRDRVWLMSKATKALSDNWVNIEMISQWRLQRSIIFWIDETNMKKAVNVLHNTFITK